MILNLFHDSFHSFWIPAEENFNQSKNILSFQEHIEISLALLASLLLFFWKFCLKKNVGIF